MKNKKYHTVRTNENKIINKKYHTVGTIPKLIVEQEHLSSPPVFGGVRVTRSIGLYVCFDH
jgi:hypothetical protein